MLASRLSAIKPSPTIAVSNMAAEMKAAGKDVDREKPKGQGPMPGDDGVANHST